MTLSIIGQGYVGLTVSKFAGEMYRLIGFDRNETFVGQLNKGVTCRMR